ncbi:hypothetical protein MLGJGCBP_03737 [Rhodococcus sp. T7]|nr:hypothetical protein MLGJGCBP_03737 [Rhodococcus sp. T7]
MLTGSTFVSSVTHVYTWVIGIFADAAARNRAVSRSWPSGSKKESFFASRPSSPAAKCAARSAARTSSVTHDSGSHHQVFCPSATFCGSKIHTFPPLASRGSRVASTTSRLFEVVNTAPGASRIAGITRELLFPERGPQMSTCMSSYLAYRFCPDNRCLPIGTPGAAFSARTTPNRSDSVRHCFSVSDPTSRNRPMCLALSSTRVRLPRLLARSTRITAAAASTSTVYTAMITVAAVDHPRCPFTRWIRTTTGFADTS